jgi:3-oxoadipate enol-lactonase
MSLKSVRGISIGYDEYGSGIPLVLLHGHPFNRSMWQDQRETLQSICRVITPDLRGYGETTIVPGKTTMEDFAGDLAALLDALEIDQIILGGLSMGGQIVFEFYRQYPTRVLALLLADTQPQVDTDVVEKVRQMILHTPPEGAAAALRGRAERRDYTPLLRDITGLYCKNKSHQIREDQKMR